MSLAVESPTTEFSPRREEIMHARCTSLSRDCSLTLAPSGSGSSGLTRPPATSSGHKRKEPGDSYCCVVCMEVLLDPVTLPCGHSLDKACLEQVIATTPLVRGRRAPCCPTCRGRVPKPPPCVTVSIRDVVEERYLRRCEPALL